MKDGFFSEINLSLFSQHLSTARIADAFSGTGYRTPSQISPSPFTTWAFRAPKNQSPRCLLWATKSAEPWPFSISSCRNAPPRLSLLDCIHPASSGTAGCCQLKGNVTSKYSGFDFKNLRRTSCMTHASSMAVKTDASTACC
jgi:hypothetical protein